MRMFYSNNFEQKTGVFVPVSVDRHWIEINGFAVKGAIPVRDITNIQYEWGFPLKTVTVVAGPTRHYFKADKDTAKAFLDTVKHVRSAL